MVAAQLALEAGHPQEALSHLSAAAASRTNWRIADLWAQALFALRNLDGARSEAERSIAELERERASLGVGPLRAAYFASRAGPYSRLVAIDLALGDTAAAFATAASLPGRSLVERLGGWDESAGSVAAVAVGERLLMRAAALERALDALGDGPGVEAQRTSLEAALAAVRVAYEEQLATTAVAPGGRLLGLGSMSLAAVQSHLSRDEALLAFLSGPDRLDLFLVRNRSVFHSAVPVGEQALAVRVRLARELVAGAPRGLPVPAALGELHDLLFGAVTAAGGLEGVTRLLLVPHGALGALPFAALWDRKAGRYLVEDQVLTYLPAVAALGDPREPAAAPAGRLTVFAPLPDSLPGTAREARTIKRLVPNTQMRLGSASGEVGMREALGAGRAVLWHPMAHTIPRTPCSHVWSWVAPTARVRPTMAGSRCTRSSASGPPVRLSSSRGARPAWGRLVRTPSRRAPTRGRWRRHSWSRAPARWWRRSGACRMQRRWISRSSSTGASRPEHRRPTRWPRPNGRPSVGEPAPTGPPTACGVWVDANRRAPSV